MSIKVTFLFKDVTNTAEMKPLFFQISSQCWEECRLKWEERNTDCDIRLKKKKNLLHPSQLPQLKRMRSERGGFLLFFWAYSSRV